MSYSDEQDFPLYYTIHLFSFTRRRKKKKIEIDILPRWEGSIAPRRQKSEERVIFSLRGGAGRGSFYIIAETRFQVWLPLESADFGRFDLVFLGCKRNDRAERERERNRGFSHDHVGMRSPLCQENSQSRFSLRCGYHGANDSYRANLWNSLNSAWLFARGRFLTRPRTMAKWCAQCLFPLV